MMSSTARECPKCGNPNDYNQKDIKIKKFFIIAFVILVLIFSVIYIALETETNSYDTRETMNLNLNNNLTTQNFSPSQSKIEDILAIRKEELRNNWQNFIKAELAENFLYREIGGLFNIKIKVNNQSEFYFEKVIVNVEYIKSNGGLFKTEELVFNNINPNSWIILSAPDSKRGTTIRYYIKAVQSNDLGLYYGFN